MSAHESMIAEAVERMLAQATPSAGFDGRLWSMLVEAEVPRLLRPESQGGAGEAWRDASAVLQAAGAHAAAVPLADTLIAHALLGQAGLDADARPVRLSIAAPDGRPDPADAVVLPDAHRLVLDAWGTSAVGTWYAADGAAPKAFEFADGEALRARLALAGAAMLTGALRTAIGLGVEYAGLRKAFGRPIGQFQAVQHPLAVAAEDVAASRAALDWAAAGVEAGGGAVAAAVAKARAAEAAGRVAAIVHQVHGAIGFTAEHALHRSSLVLWHWRDRWGDEHDWHALLGERALAAGPEGLFDLLDGVETR